MVDSTGIIVMAIALGIVTIAAIVEISLRSLFGFGNPLTYVADPQIGYLLTPGQHTRRFGNEIIINRYSMRSPDMAATRPAQTLRILLLGDSIANGGWWTDQRNTVSALMQRQLTPAFQQVEVLNASANSWGPRNELAYLKRYGSFEAQAIVLLINTDDLFATAPSSLVVGRDRNYPDHKPPLAIAEAISRYLLKPAPIPELDALQAEGGDRVGINLDAIRQVQAIAVQAHARFVLAMTPLLREVGAGPRDYEKKARQRLNGFTEQEKIDFIDFLPIFNREKTPKALYHDHIHFNQVGSQLISQTIAEHLQKNLR